FGVGILTPEGELLEQQSYDTPHSEDEPVALDAVASAVGGIMEQATVKPDQVLGVGVGIPGPVDPEAGIIKQAPNMHELDGVNAVEVIGEGLEFGDETQIPVRIANDAYCHTLAELRYGAGRDVENLVMFTLGTGVGGGIALDNTVRRGPRQVMGEVGHIVVEPSGRRCGCGNHGCLEAIVGRDGMIDQAVRLLERGIPSVLASRGGRYHEQLSPKMIAEAAHEGDEVALEVMNTSGHYIGVALCSCIVLADPDLIVLGGGIANAGEVLFAPIRRTVHHRSMISGFDTDSIVPSQLGGDAGMLGAAALIVDEMG
ncbi:MAG: ROK family protein, partial [Armatimonadia bacterium]|nr:ROK family protein [Armatimonadia bacterium]